MQLKFLFSLTLIFSISLTNAEAQDTASVAWSLTANTQVSATVGNVAGRDERFSHSPTDSTFNVTPRDYTAAGGGQRIHLGTTTNWPHDTVENSGRFVQFAVSPVNGMTLHVSTIALDIGAGGTGAMNANIYYSTDSTFATRVKLNSGSALPNSAWLVPSPSFQVNVDVPFGGILFVRVYPWYNSANASTTKYLYLRNVIVSGSTVSGGTYAPTLTTASVTNIGATSATCGGNVTWSGGATVSARGVCWNTTGSPTINDNKTIDGSGAGPFASAMTGLTEGTRYYVRAYATNSVGTGYGNDQSFVATNPPQRLLAFPGAEGYGKFTSGGRGGAVYEVTNLNDNGPGSLRAAITASGPRTVVFRVSGTITLNSNLTISNPYITIAGQTAPGDGICIRRYSLTVATNNVIIRHLRVRLGDESGGMSDAMGGRGCRNVIIDHCSASWSVDEAMSFYWCDSITVQWCFITESLYNSNHPSGAHGYGGIWGGPNTTYHHNLFAHHSSRNPRFGSGVGNTDYRNNVIYNWGFNSAYGGEDTSDGSARGFSNINMVANYYRSGPATSSGRVKYRIVNPSTHASNIEDPTHYGKWYVAANFVFGYPNVTADNWGLGVQPQSESVKAAIRSATEFDFVPIDQHSAEDAFARVLARAGATRPVRDTVDRRIVREASTGAVTYGGATYAIDRGLPTGVPYGILDSQTDVGGWPLLNSTAPPADTDHDGMPDAWESSHGLNLNDPNDRNGIGEGGYTNLENYLNSSELLSAVANEEQRPLGMKLYPNYPNPFNPTTNIKFKIPNIKSYSSANLGFENWNVGIITLKVCDVLGKEVATLVNEKKSPGTYEVKFDGSNLSSGIYFAVLVTEGRRLSQKMLLVK
ncbi:MAG: T9SS type A sorting domain-containing protein [Ignavibacteriae bacterium]|nr:T9SS type A sorting domain-containing protein [Ignavibacteriota bacterium]